MIWPPLGPIDVIFWRMAAVYPMVIQWNDTWEPAMIKTLTKHGNSYALIIDKAILELLNIGPDSPLEITTDGNVLIVCPAADPKRRKRFETALKKTNRKYGRTLKKLAE